MAIDGSTGDHAMTADERDFTVAEGGAPADVFAPDHLAKARGMIAAAAALADTEAARDGYAVPRIAQPLAVTSEDGLGQVLAAIPEDYHPLDVAAFMTTRNEHLGGRSPVEWLAAGLPPGAVAALADELGYQ
ncbi:MAG: hypothetical protein QM628_15525 [Propionicimonas sp.]